MLLLLLLSVFHVFSALKNKYICGVLLFYIFYNENIEGRLRLCLSPM